MNRVEKVTVYYVLHVIYAKKKKKKLGSEILDAQLYRAICTS